MKELKFISPFKKLCITIGNLPTAYIESMSYYEGLTFLVNYLANNVIPAVNNNSEVVKELQDQFVILKNYVDNYFDNLDVQEEINTKLDEMADSGQLTDIIAQYLGLAGMLTFNTVADMKNAENLVNGSTCHTMGFYSINDGGGATYKVRIITNEDVVDESFIIALNDVNLVAELIYDDINVKALGTKGDGINNDGTIIQNAIDHSINKGNVIIPDGNYLIETTLKTYGNTNLILSNNAYIIVNSVDGIYLDGNSNITGGTILCGDNYSHTAVTILPCSNTNLDEKTGGLHNVAIKNTTLYSTDSIGIGCAFIDNLNVESNGITFMTFNDCTINGFEYGIKFYNTTPTKWVNSLNVDNLKMCYCKEFIYAHLGRDFTGNKFTNIHIQTDKDYVQHVIYLDGRSEDNYFNIIEWDLATSNTNVIYLGTNTLNNKIEADRIYNYGLLNNIISDNGESNYITSAFIENTYLERTNMKYIDLTDLDNTKAYPVLFENMCNIKIWKNSEAGYPYSYLYAYIDATSPKASTMMGNYFARISTSPSQQLLPEISANASNKYIAVYLRGGFKYNFLDYNYQYQQTNSVEYYYDNDWKDPYRIITTSFTSAGITYVPISTHNSIPIGMYFAGNSTINLDNNSTPLTLS